MFNEPMWPVSLFSTSTAGFPNLDQFPLVPLGLCKMLARETKAMSHTHESEIEVIVATAGYDLILQILEDMSQAMAEKTQAQWYNDEPCRFIYRTTGPKRVGHFLQTNGDEPLVTVFSMCRPLPDLEKHISLDDTGRVCCHRSGMDSYDVWSAFSMNHNTGDPKSPRSAPA